LITFEPENVQGRRITGTADFSGDSDVENLNFSRNGEENFGIRRQLRIDRIESANNLLGFSADKKGQPKLSCNSILLEVLKKT
jgi:hypothetical protein